MGYFLERKTNQGSIDRWRRGYDFAGTVGFLLSPLAIGRCFEPIIAGEKIMKATKKQIRMMKALYTDADVAAFQKLIDRQWQIVETGVDNDDDENAIAETIITIFQLALNEQVKMVSTFDSKAYERALNDSASDKGDVPEKKAFDFLNAAKSDFAFGHVFHRMDQLVIETLDRIRVFMRQYPRYEEAVRTLWHVMHQ
ncbi:hypothetical protein [Pseudoramibacter alactolyticus]|uniref:hypothetical protein n=1 Tax=Pseudoramibacter alactolyticus TaxID=113287 RepID=UPI00248EE155|nr:hypothetical protein [Pseudoramibacter alactolyticus]